jgi:small subunit ribosomal protein S3
MIERKFVNQNIQEFEIKEYVKQHLSRVGLSDVKLQRTPLGEKIIISTSRPGLVVGRSGTNITKLTQELKQVFKLENPQIEIEEVKSLGLDANIIAEMIANSLEKFGIARFKGIGHKAMAEVMNAGAFGVEILIGGKVPSTRAKTWRFYQGYLKKCGDIAVSQIKVAYASAQLKSGTIGIKVSIMTPDIVLPDRMAVIKPEAEEQEQIPQEQMQSLQEPGKVEEVKDEPVKKEMEEKVKELAKAKTKKSGARSSGRKQKAKPQETGDEKKSSDRKKTSKKARLGKENPEVNEDAEPADSVEIAEAVEAAEIAKAEEANEPAMQSKEEETETGIETEEAELE